MDRPLSLWGNKTLWSGYRLIKLRGRGSFGQVWEAATPEESKVALKFMQCRDSLAAAEEVRSIRRVRELSHPGLLSIDKVWADRGFVVVAMELAEGSLWDLLHVSRQDFGMALPQDQVIDYLTPVASALDFLNHEQHSIEGHRASIQHCDIKPANLLLCRDGIKIGDFGLASVHAADAVSHRKAGTLAYAAPEVFRGQLSRWTDQYALAVSYCELRTGRLPFARSPSRFGNTFTRSEPDLSLFSSGERAVIGKALRVTPRDRWPTCSQLFAELSRETCPNLEIA